MPDGVADAYDAFASVYDEFNHRNDYELWFGALLPELEGRGLRKGRLLDVGCGTGKAFEPMLRRGWEVSGCDISAGMLAEARRKFGDRVPLELADVRELPKLGEFDLVWSLNDVVNYQVEDGDLERALAGLRANLAPGGLLLFDGNTFGLFQSHFAAGGENQMSVGEWQWEGVSSEVVPGGIFESRLSGGGLEPRHHRERHYPEAAVRAAMEAVGLECLAALGQRETATQVILEEPADEQRDYKIIYIGRAAGE
jgi:SAM-dependent methyltransferase